MFKGLEKFLTVMMIFTITLTFINVSKASAFTEAGVGNSQGFINSASLNPVRTGERSVDDYIDSILGQITTSDMDTYEKVKACYDYLINNVSYGNNGYFPAGVKKSFTSEYDVNIVGNGIQTLYGKSGTCDGYSSAFVLLTRAIGLDSYVVTGNTATVGGGWTGHAWVNIYINGKYYVFDPQVEDNIAKGGQINYYCFCKTNDEVASDYSYTDRNADVYKFKSFSESNGWEDHQCYEYRQGTTPQLVNRWYYYINGKIQKGWLEWNSKKYYLQKEDGLMVTGICKIDSKFYEFDSSGALLRKIYEDALDNGTQYYDCDSSYYSSVGNSYSWR